MTASEWRRAEAKVRVEQALAQIQMAQGALESARAALAPVRGAATSYGQLGEIRDRVNAEWYRTRELLDHPRLEMDRDPTLADLAAAKAGAPRD